MIWRFVRFHTFFCWPLLFINFTVRIEKFLFSNNFHERAYWCIGSNNDLCRSNSRITDFWITANTMTMGHIHYCQLFTYTGNGYPYTYAQVCHNNIMSSVQTCVYNSDNVSYLKTFSHNRLLLMIKIINYVNIFNC